MIAMYNSGWRLGAWTALTPPAFLFGIRALGASVDPDPNPYGTGHSLFEVMYMDARHEQHVLWNDVDGSKQWLQREKIAANEPLTDFDGHGARFSPVQPRAGLDLSVRMPLFVTPDGRVGTSRYIETDTSAGWTDMFLPKTAPPADARKRPTLTMNAFNNDLVAGYRDLQGDFVIHRGSLDRVDTDHKDSVWYDGASIVTDVAPDMREVSLAVTTVPLEDYWVVTVAQDGQMRLWSLISRPGTPRTSDRSAQSRWAWSRPCPTCRSSRSRSCSSRTRVKIGRRTRIRPRTVSPTLRQASNRSRSFMALKASNVTTSPAREHGPSGARQTQASVEVVWSPDSAQIGSARACRPTCC